MKYNQIKLKKKKDGSNFLLKDTVLASPPIKLVQVEKGIRLGPQKYVEFKSYE